MFLLLSRVACVIVGGGFARKRLKDLMPLTDESGDTRALQLKCSGCCDSDVGGVVGYVKFPGTIQQYPSLPVTGGFIRCILDSNVSNTPIFPRVFCTAWTCLPFNHV